jgi:predicted TIM-barrel fold metal-dependent hydrolase
MKIADPTHLLYGSDTPYTPAEMVARNKEGLASDPLIAPIARDVLCGNAARLYGLDQLV